MDCLVRKYALIVFLGGLTLAGLFHRALLAQIIPPPISLGEYQSSLQASPELSTVYLVVTLNDNRLTELVPFTVKDRQLYASPAVLRGLGFRGLDNNQTLISLGDIPHLQQDYHQSTQAVTLSIPIAELDLERVIYTNDASADVEVSKGTGLLLNYDLYGWALSHKYKSLSAFTEWRFFNPYGVLSNTSIYKATRSPLQPGWKNETVRLDTQWETSWPGSAISLRLGDTLTASLPWSRSLRIGGVQLSRNFSLQPYFSTAPLSSFLGEAALPSTAELYINGIKQFEQKVPSGPFEIQSMPYINGAGNATLVLTDTQGRQQSVELPFYSTSMLLRQGLADWSVEAGYVRKNYGIQSNKYAKDPVFSGALRYGLTDAVTGEAHAEVTRGLVNYGVAANIRLGQLGVITGSYAGSRHNDVPGDVRGNMHAVGYQWQGKYFHVNARMQKADRHYRDIAFLYGSDFPETNQVVSTGLNLGTFGSLGVSYIKLGFFKQPESRYANAYWSKSLGRSTYLSVNYNKNLNEGGGYSVYAGVSFSLGNNYRVSTSVNHANDQQRYAVDISKATRENMGWSWHLQGSHGDNVSFLYGSADYRGRYGEYGLGGQFDKNYQAGYVSTRGSVVVMSGGVFPGRKISDGFAVVSTNGVADVPVKLENNVYGTTNQSGLLMVSPLHAYQRNKIDIDTMNLPANMSIDKVSAEVSTQTKSGTRVLFKIQPVRAATVVLHDVQDRPLVLGTRVLLNGKHGTIVGYDGIVYLDQLEDNNFLEASNEKLTCKVEFKFNFEENTIPRIGPFTCR